jgi:CheY-like chemotaxis protein
VPRFAGTRRSAQVPPRASTHHPRGRTSAPRPGASTTRGYAKPRRSTARPTIRRRFASPPPGAGGAAPAREPACALSFRRHTVVTVSKKSALVVDDDDAIRGLIRTVLMRHGFEVEQAANGHDAIDRIKSKRYDAIVLDLMMPNGIGDDVLDAIAIELPDVKCVVVISAAAAARIENIVSANVVAKLRKPFDIDELVDAVEKCAEA